MLLFKHQLYIIGFNNFLIHEFHLVAGENCFKASCMMIFCKIMTVSSPSNVV